MIAGNACSRAQRTFAFRWTHHAARYRAQSEDRRHRPRPAGGETTGARSAIGDVPDVSRATHDAARSRISAAVIVRCCGSRTIVRDNDLLQLRRHVGPKRSDRRGRRRAHRVNDGECVGAVRTADGPSASRGLRRRATRDRSERPRLHRPPVPATCTLPCRPRCRRSVSRAIVSVSVDENMAMPKSSTLTWPAAVSIRFDGFRSRWTMPARVRGGRARRRPRRPAARPPRSAAARARDVSPASRLRNTPSR